CSSSIRHFHPLSIYSLPLPRTSTLFPYTTLFRSTRPHHRDGSPPRRPSSHQGRCAPRRGPHLRQPAQEHHRRPGLLHHGVQGVRDRKSTRLNSSHVKISYAVFCLKKKKTKKYSTR